MQQGEWIDGLWGKFKNLRLFLPLKYPNEYLELCYKKENNFFIVIH